MGEVRHAPGVAALLVSFSRQHSRLLPASLSLLLVSFGGFLLLLHFTGVLPHLFPLTIGSLDTQRSNADAGCILKPGFVLFSLPALQ